MADGSLSTPVAFIIFNRPDTTEKVFAEIARARPPKLLVIADGPRATRAGEAERCAATRAIIGRVDWACELLTNYSDVNLGCKNRVASGIDWVFEQVPEAIILEDDCLPHPTFFRFCEELLDRYRDGISLPGDKNSRWRRWYLYSSHTCHATCGKTKCECSSIRPVITTIIIGSNITTIKSSTISIVR